GWPTWTTPVMRWAKQQGGITGYAHSASGLHIDPPAAARWLLERADADRSGGLTSAEAERVLLPQTFEKINANKDQSLSEAELRQSIDRVADQLPNFAVPAMTGVGAMEIAVTAA